MTLRRLAAFVLLLIVLSPALGAQQPPPEPQDEFVPISELPPQDQLPAAPLLVTAYAFAWLAIGGYVYSVARRLATVQREIERLEAETRQRR